MSFISLSLVYKTFRLVHSQKIKIGRGLVIGYGSVNFVKKFFAEVAFGPEEPYLLFGGVGVQLSQTCHCQHFAKLVGAKDSLEFGGSRHPAIYIQQDLFGFRACVCLIHISNYTNLPVRFNNNRLTRDL